ncbi:MAG: Undecaprenyl phosphate-alpha-4-amino-4-deoxy-L-arabinose arabinosyl transferase [Verrucomicrobia bacterium ADurb.Bin122]|nr:MAG: Undecaprenyl phosphate-alpha-4-amino-4-deoxy-L-arabinose arabinosyl transferase [Verrucomicrobia bacterium ADurb.Bin122]
MAGWAAAGVLATSLLYFALGHILLLDMPVSAFMSGTLFCFILGVREAPGGRRRAMFYGLYACAALATLSKGLIGFLLPGAVMFVWLLVFNQWKRLRPLYLPSGLVLFFAIAAPWHLLAAQRNPDWAHFYFVREHWLRFTTTMHDRYQPWWYFIPILLAGFIPWVGYLPQAIRSAVAGGWARRKENADAWFFVTWALVIFLFFSKSQSKLVPYILPVFPPLAVLVGAWLADVAAAGQAVRLRWGLRIFAFLCGAIGVAAVVATFKTGLIRNTEQALALRPYAAAIAAALLIGGALAPWLAKTRGARAALFAQAGTMLAMLLVLATALPHLQKPGTKPLALLYASTARPGDRVFHYQDYFHDFTFYAACQVGSVDYPASGELGLDIDAEARASGRFIGEAEFRRQWSAGTGRIWLLIRKEAAAALFSDPSFHYRLQGETRKHYLVTNQP